MTRLLDYDAGTGDLENWLIRENRFDDRFLGKCEAIFAQGNGYLGVRNALEESYAGETRNMFVAGTFDRIDESEVTELPNLPDVTAVTLRVNGYRFHLGCGALHRYGRTLNLKNGETVRQVEWTAPDGSRMRLEFRRFVSLADRHVIAARIGIIPVSQGIRLEVESGIDGSVGNHGAQHFHAGQCRICEGRDLQMLSTTFQSGVTAAVHTAHLLSRKADSVLPVMGRRTLANRYSLTLEKGETLRLEKISCVHTSRDPAYAGRSGPLDETLKRDGREELDRACALGYDRLLERSAAEWARRWRTGGVTVRSENPYDQLGIRFALYHLNIMTAGDDSRVGIGAKGLTGEGYKGHSFWDTDLFIQPYFTLTHPRAARALLGYRYRNLYGARLKAKRNGYRGAMIPWECAWIDDGEVTPPYLGADVVTGESAKVLTGLIEQHVTADVAYAVRQYELASGDEDFMDRCGCEILMETAVFWASRAEYDAPKDRYEINDVIGPDEYKEHVDNNAYTNYMAHFNMKLALRAAQALRRKDPERFRRLDAKTGFSASEPKIREVCEKLYLPVPGGSGIVPQTDGYLSLEPLDLSPYKDPKAPAKIGTAMNAERLNRYMVSKQADLVMLLFLRPNLFGPETARKNFLFYEAHTLHDSSLSKCIHSIVACRLGLEDAAYRLFEESLDIDLGPGMQSSDDGIHAAAMGGIWQCAVVGFGGVEAAESGLKIDPRLPEAWEELRFPLVWHGVRLSVRVTRGAVEVENGGSAAVPVEIGGEKVLVQPGGTVRVALTRERG